MANAHGARKIGAPMELVGKDLQSALGLVDGQSAQRAVVNGHTGRVIATVFQPGQPIQQNRGGLFLSYVTYNTTHIIQFPPETIREDKLAAI